MMRSIGELQANAQAGARGAGAVGGIEGERARLQFVDGGAVVGAAVLLAEALLIEAARIGRGHQHDPLPQAQGRLDRIGQSRGIRIGMVGVECSAFGVVVAHDEPVDHDLDGMALVLVQRRCLIKVHQLAIYADTHEALPAGSCEDALPFCLAVLDERPQDKDATRIGQLADAIGDLLHRHACDLTAALGTVRMTHACEQQAQVIVDLGDRPDGRTRVS